MHVGGIQVISNQESLNLSPFMALIELYKFIIIFIFGKFSIDNSRLSIYYRI